MKISKCLMIAILYPVFATALSQSSDVAKMQNRPLPKLESKGCLKGRFYSQYLKLPAESKIEILPKHRECIDEFIKVAALRPLPDGPNIPGANIPAISAICIAQTSANISLSRLIAEFIRGEDADYQSAKLKAKPEQLALLEKAFEKAGDLILYSMQIDCRFKGDPNSTGQAAPDSPYRKVKERSDILNISTADQFLYEKKKAACGQ